MTDKKLTDEEIIRRLERCVKRGNRNYDTDIVLNLINRPRAKIERLEKELTEYKLRLKMSECTVDEIKSEAYKEFAEKLKKRFYLSAGRCVVDVYYIGTLLKEMVGE